MLTNGRVVPAEDRASLQGHLDKLNLWFDGSDPEDIVPQVSMLRSVMSRAQTDGGDEKRALLVFARVLSELPLWAISRACDDYLTGRAGDGRFAPTPAEISARCRVLMARYVEDKIKIERALGIVGDRQQEPWEDDLR